MASTSSHSYKSCATPKITRGLTIYRLAYGVTYNALEDAFGISKDVSFSIKWFALYFDIFMMSTSSAEQVKKNGSQKFVDSLQFPMYWCMGWLSCLYQLKTAGLDNLFGKFSKDGATVLAKPNSQN